MYNAGEEIVKENLFIHIEKGGKGKLLKMGRVLTKTFPFKKGYSQAKS